MARTIDNLGVDVSTRYAEDQAFYEPTFTKESRSVPGQTNISVTIPSFPSEFDLLFGLSKRGARFANFLAPPNYYSSRRRLFAELLIPDLGSLEKQETQMERIKAVGEEEKQKKKQQHAPAKEEEEVALEEKILLSLLEKIHLFDQDLIDINSRRSQYQKG